MGGNVSSQGTTQIPVINKRHRHTHAGRPDVNKSSSTATWPSTTPETAAPERRPKVPTTHHTNDCVLCCAVVADRKNIRAVSASNLTPKVDRYYTIYSSSSVRCGCPPGWFHFCPNAHTAAISSPTLRIYPRHPYYHPFPPKVHGENFIVIIIIFLLIQVFILQTPLWHEYPFQGYISRAITKYTERLRRRDPRSAFGSLTHVELIIKGDDRYMCVQWNARDDNNKKINQLIFC